MTDLDLNQSLNKKFLLIDDFANVRKSVKGMLNSLGVSNVAEAANGLEATRLVRDHKFDVILCDYNLGKGKNGSQLLEEWRSRGWLSYQTVFVMITAETSRDFVMGALEYQPEDYLAKPFAMDTLQARLDRWLDRQSALGPINQALDKKDYPALARAAREVMENKPRYRGWAQRKYAEALYEQGQTTEAAHFLQALLDKRDLPWARLERHRIDVEQGKLEAAERGLKTLIMMQPNMVEAYDLLAEVQQSIKQPEKAQETLSQALARSPRNIARQRAFAGLASDNGDHVAATRAYKEIVSLAEGTMHESSRGYKDVLRSTRTQLQSLDDEALKRRLQRDAQSLLKKLVKQYSEEPDTELFGKAYRAYLAEAGDVSATDQAFLESLAREAREQMAELGEDSALDIVDILYEKGLSKEADALVEDMRQYHKESVAFVKRLNQLQAEPVSHEARRQAHRLNTEGIELYKQKDYQAATRLFDEALACSPRHPGIILNYVQSSLLLMGQSRLSVSQLDRCLDIVNRLDYLPADHYQFERYTNIRDKVLALHTKVKHE
jgi:DNA-binding response OmpR family regulator